MTPLSEENFSESPRLRPAMEAGTLRTEDAELFIRRAFDENPRAGYELLFRRYYQPLYSHAARLVYSPDIADDIVSEVFLNFWLSEAFRRVTSSFRAYLLISVRHAAFAHLRREFTHDSLDASDVLALPAQSLSGEKTMLFDELYLRIDQAIRGLPPQNQKVFMLSRFDGKSHAEIAQQLAISPRTVEVHIHKALQRLRRVVASQ